MKYAGLLLIILVCGGMGMMKSMQYTARVRYLEAILSFLQTLASEMEYRAAPISKILADAAGREEYKCLPFLRECERLCREGTEFPTAWAQAVREKAKAMDLSERDRKLLLSFGCGVGTTDVDGQLANCSLHKELFGQSLQSAREEKDKHGKLYLKLGLLSGIGISIVLL